MATAQRLTANDAAPGGALSAGTASAPVVADTAPAPTTIIAAPPQTPAAPAPARVPLTQRYAQPLRVLSERGRPLALGALALGGFVLLWYLATKYKLDLYIRFANIPSPGAVLDHTAALAKTERFYENMLISMRRVLLGFGIATVLGVALGLLIGRYRTARELMFPVFEVLRPIPAIAWVPISIMLWPSNETSIVFITFLGSFFPILLNTIHGVHAVDAVLIRAARCLGAGEIALFREVILPGALPHIFTGLSVGMGVAWVSLIAAEMISGQFGVGYFTWEAYSLIQYADIVIGMIVIGILGLACSGGIRMLSRALMPWARTREGRL